ncbi:MAG TPA: 1,4-alpha-glucan branching protein domain-containing protein, partial [Thermodesulfovibrionales bacterium]|nr:1,4-alpha-glucan branching protein domain-containing protein [Thermodesulfovibrionales bacterium]
GYLTDERIRFFFLDTHGIQYGRPSPPCGVYEPVECPSGAIAFGRDPDTSEQVWSSIVGYPGDPSYRDFYTDIGFDLDVGHVRDFLRPFGAKTFTGLKYYRVTGRSGPKSPYVKARADKKAAEHARHFIAEREKQVQRLTEEFNTHPVVNAVYDAELFGHWWFEGPKWLNRVLRGIDGSRGSLKTATPEMYLAEVRRYRRKIQECEPSFSSWGERGYGDVWVNAANDYTCRHILKAAERMIYLAGRYPAAEGLVKRALNQAAREVYLAQHSDWPFIMNAGTAKEYASRRFEEHISRFSRLYESILGSNISEQWLSEVEGRDNIFRDIDYRDFG